MKTFLKKIISFSLPFLIVLMVIIGIDFFKIFGFHKDYYSNNFVGLNRSTVTTKTYKHYRTSEKFNAFIFGSSRTLSYNIDNWAKHLNRDAKTFHFDAAGEGIWGVLKKMEYITAFGDKINHALIVLDQEALTVNTNRSGHLYIENPEVSKESKKTYYSEFFKVSINPKFIFAYTDYALFKTHRDYMGFMIHRRKYQDSVNTINCDFFWGYDKQIQEDSIKYYNMLIDKNVFYDRAEKIKENVEITDIEIAQLKKIKTLLDYHNTDYKIVISPLYDQIPLDSHRLKILNNIFGKAHVFNFSGENKFTEPISNFYEASHYKPYIANEIMNIIYNNEHQIDQ